MKIWRAIPGGGIDGLNLADERPAALGPRQVRVRNRAATLNFRDLARQRRRQAVRCDGEQHALKCLADGNPVAFAVTGTVQDS